MVPPPQPVCAAEPRRRVPLGRAAGQGLRTDTGGTPGHSSRAGAAAAGQRAQQSGLSPLGFLPFSELIFFPLNNHCELFLFLI